MGRWDIKGEQQQSLLIFSVSDSGSGIANEVLESVFNRYHQVNNKRGGVGLGLFVARAIAQLHGGNLRVSPSLQGGSCFQLSIFVTQKP